ncbi:MAG: hypothetical protein DRJ42_03275 [Deltaproteobacteria bacterium]|nr:MAG: hypothetical protein DRJ42_03275 [Deltaproteobacteria bacterium]
MAFRALMAGVVPLLFACFAGCNTDPMIIVDSATGLDGGEGPDGGTGPDATADAGFDPADYDPGIGATLAAEVDGTHQIAVRRPDGELDTVWIQVLSPDGPGPFPTVVYAHGLNNTGLTNCRPAATTFISNRTRTLADAGYLAVAVFYRHIGRDAPALDELRFRDNQIWDASAMLSAARWARDYHAKGTNRVALLGTSMGTWPTTWAISEHADLAPHQEGLEVRTIVTAAESANEISNVGRKWDRDPVAGTGLGLSFGLPWWIAAHRKMPTLVAADFDPSTPFGADIATLLTPATTNVIVQLIFTDGQSLFDAIPTLTECEGIVGVSAACTDGCLEQFVVHSYLQEPAREDIATWLEPAGLEALSYWDPPSSVDPGADTANVGLAAQRAMSPTYSAVGPARTARALHLLSINDSHYDATSRQIYQDKLAAMGIETITSPDIDRDSTGARCDHLDYLDPARPMCGYAAVITELTTAFSD